MAQTYVIVPTCAASALAAYCQRIGHRREPVLRGLLESYIDQQEARAPGDRLTHVSTVIWHPDMPVGRHNPSPYATRLPMRLPPGMANAAREVALLLPGQADGGGGYHDYRPRQLADAAVTALASEVAFTDDILDGLPPLLTQRAARGLFRLAVAATATPPRKGASTPARTPIKRL